MEAIQLLIKSSLQQGAIISDLLEFRDDPGSGVGVFVSDRCDQGTVLISIPRKLCVSAESIMNYSVLKPIFSEFPSLVEMPDEVLALGLIYAFANNDEECPWYNHVKTLPRSFNTTLFWSEEEMNELKGHNVFHLTNMLKRQVLNDFQAIYLPIFNSHPELFQNLDIDIYVWALSIVYSRSLDITIQNETQRIIVPVLDMLNHSPFAAETSHDTFNFDEDLDVVQYRTASELKANDQCFAVYGHYPNSKLLYTYGFVVPHNPIRAIDLWTRVTPSTQDSQYKQKLLQENELTRNQTYDFKGTIRSNYVSPALLATIRVIQANPSEYPDIENAFQGMMVSVRNELATYTSLKELLRLRLKADQAQVRLFKKFIKKYLFIMTISILVE